MILRAAHAAGLLCGHFKDRQAHLLTDRIVAPHQFLNLLFCHVQLFAGLKVDRVDDAVGVDVFSVYMGADQHLAAVEVFRQPPRGFVGLPGIDRRTLRKALHHVVEHHAAVLVVEQLRVQEIVVDALRLAVDAADERLALPCGFLLLHDVEHHAAHGGAGLCATFVVHKMYDGHTAHRPSMTARNAALTSDSTCAALSRPMTCTLSMLNTGVSPNVARGSSLSQILQDAPPIKYYLSPKACLGILRRASERGKALPPKLERALKIQAGLMRPDGQPTDLNAFHINQRDEGIDLHGVSGALMATTNMQMQTFVTQPDDTVEGFDGYNGDLTGDVAATLGVNCGMSTGRNGVMAFAANQRDEVRDLHDVAGALNAQPGMKQQTFVAAAFSAGAGASAGSIGYGEELAPTLKGSASGNCMPSVLCLNDQGGSVMECSENVSGTLRAQEHGHQPLVYENHGIDARYTGPHQVAPTMSARYGTGGNNVPLVEQEETFCITGNAIDRQPQNGGNGIGYQRDIAYTLTATDHHAVYSRQRVDDFRENGVVSTQSARQHKDATDLVCQKAEAYAYLIRRLTPLECERLQGFPDGWTDIPDASDSARYKALGNSVAIPCVEFIMGRIAAALRAV